MLHMEQKNFKLEIVCELLKSRNHIREIAKRLGTNHMLILRKMRELSDENVVDYKEEGKNKTYFLKNSAEAKSCVFMAEHYILMKTLGKYPALRRIVENIQKMEKIRLAVLFGSYAKGLAGFESDVDIFIETTERGIKWELEATDSKVSIKIGNYDKSSLLIKEIEKNHVIIKGIEAFYEKNRFFN